MKNFFLIIFLSVTLSTRLTAQITFQKTFGIDSIGDYGQSVVQSGDEGYFVAGVEVIQVGATTFIGNGVILRTDKYGNQLWRNSYTTPSSTDLTFDNINKTSDNNLIVTGVVNYGFTNDYYDVYLSKIDTNGNVLWYKNYGGLHRQRGMQVKETFDNGFVIGGWNEVNGSANSISFYLIKTNSFGDTIWTRAYPNNGMRQTGYAVEQTPDSGFVIVGSIQQPTQIGTDIFIVKTNPAGDTLWTKIIDYSGTGEARDVKISSNGNIIISGWISPTSCADPILTELDQNGNIIWFYSYNSNTGFCEWNYSLCNTNDNGYAIFGMDGSSDYYLVKIDSVGNQQWFNKFNESSTDYGYNVRQTSDGGFIMTGITSNTNSNIILIKTDSSGNVLSAINEIRNSDNFFVFPNPTSNNLNIQNNSSQIIQFTLYNSLGETIISKSLTNKTSTINLSAYSNDIYFYKVLNENGEIKSGKIVKQ